MMSTILALNELALARLQNYFNINNKEAETRAENIKQALMSLKNKDGYFGYYDAVNKKEINVPSLGALFPYLLMEEVPENIISSHRLEFGLSTHSPSDSKFDPKMLLASPLLD